MAGFKKFAFFKANKYINREYSIKRKIVLTK